MLKFSTNCAVFASAPSLSDLSSGACDLRNEIVSLLTSEAALVSGEGLADALRAVECVLSLQVEVTPRTSACKVAITLAGRARADLRS
jgi:hypothetical protein